MIQISDEMREAVRSNLLDMFNQIAGNESELTVDKISGNAGFYRDNQPNGLVAQYHERLADNPAAILRDLKMRFPEDFNTYGLGDASTVARDTAPGKNPTPSAPGNVQMNVKKWWLPVAILGGLAWYFKPWK